MTDAALRRGGRRTLEVLQHPIILWGAFVLVHLWLGLLGLYAPGLPLGDVTLVYKFWVDHGFTADVWVGIDTRWVYPIVALLPMIAARAFGSGLYASTWLSLVLIIDAAAFAFVIGFGRDRRLARVGWWWLAFLVALGPVALGRIDAITVPIAIVGMLTLAAAPRLAGFLLTLAAWIKVWPAALIAAVVIAVKARMTIVVAAVVTSAVIVLVALILGAGGNVFSFITEQTGRGVQIEAPIGTFWMWDSWLHRPGGSTIYYDTSILTYQLRGPGIEIAAAVTTPLLALAVAVLLVLGVVAMRRGVSAVTLLAPLALAITTALILFNKVGSPQFVGWLAVPIVFGLSASVTGRGDSFRVPAVLGLVIAGLTQAIYPYLYNWLLASDFTLLLVLSARNLLYVVLLVWAVRALVQLVVHRPVFDDVEVDEGLPQVWPFGPGTPSSVSR